MTTGDIKKITRKIIPRLTYSNWNIYREGVIINPENGLLRGVYLNRSGLNASQFELCYFVQPLYVPFNFINLSFGGIIRTSENNQWWGFDTDTLDQLVNKMTPLINQVDINFLSKIKNAEEFYSFYRDQKELTIRHFEAVAYSAAYADLTIANNLLIDFLSFLNNRGELKLDWVKQIYDNTKELLNGNKQEILFNWEIQTRMALKLMH